MRSGLVVALVALAATAHATPRQDLDLGVKNFRAKDWQSAIRVINPLLYPRIQFASQDDINEARLLLGAAEFEAGNKDRAIEEFTRVILVDPDRELTPLMFSENAIRLFDRTKDDLKARLEHDAEKKRLAEAAARLEEYRKSLRVYEARPFGFNFFPFGGAQYIQGRTGMASLMLATQGTTFLASIGIFGYLVGTYGFRSNGVKLTDANRVLLLQRIEIGTGIAFFGFYAFGVYDAIRHHKSRQLVQGDDSLIPPEILNPTKGKPAPGPRAGTSLLDRMRFTPMVTPDSVGIGIGWEN